MNWSAPPWLLRDRRLEPGSGRALWGIAQALDGAGDRKEGDRVWAEFVKTWSTADTDLPQVRSARRAATAQ